MNSRGGRAIFVAGALFVATFLLYGLALQRVPPYLSHDEVVFSLNAQSIATSGRDVKGRLLPLFFQINAQFWATPVVVYATAMVLKVAPLTETVVRLPSVAIGAANVALVYLIGLRIFQDRRSAALGAVLLALTPAHLLHSRMATDLIYPVPFLLGAVLTWLEYLERRNLKLLFAAATLLGIGCYSYLGALVAMPLYFLLLGLLTIRRSREGMVAIAGLTWPLIALVPWLVAHPDQFAGQMQMYNVYDPSRLTPLQGVRSLVSYSSITARASAYYEFFNPSFLFFSGDSSLMNSTRASGVFLLPLMLFIPVGLYALLTGERTPGRWFVASAFLLAPVAALIVVETKINRALIMLPFGAMAAAAGVGYLLRARRWLTRSIAAVLLAAIPLQFAYFYRDYMTDYRSRSAFWFEQNKRGAFEDILARDRAREVPRIFISRTPRWIDWYWKWYLAKTGRPELLDRTVYTVPRDLVPESMAPHSVVFGEAEEVEQSEIFKTSARSVTRIVEPNGTTSFIVFER